MIKRILPVVLTLVMLFGTYDLSAIARTYNKNHNGYAYRNNQYTGYQNSEYRQHRRKLSPGTKRLLKYAAFGAGAGFVLSGREHRFTNILKGAAIGTGAGIITDPNRN